jgi:hypothetical protein
VAAGGADHDLIVCSLNLGDGVDVLRMVSQLRSLEKTRQIPILIIGDSTQTDRATTHAITTRNTNLAIQFHGENPPPSLKTERAKVAEF